MPVKSVVSIWGDFNKVDDLMMKTYQTIIPLLNSRSQTEFLS